MTTSNGCSSGGQAAGGSETKTLPKTIEGATERYLRSYEAQYKGPIEDKKRLKLYASARILRLKTKAPQFYEGKLPTLINQAASELLRIDTSTQQGKRKFHETHRHFLKVLDELKRSQPAGEVDFQIELDRAREKDDLKKKHLMLREKIDQMEAVEFDLEQLGEEEIESRYAQTFAELDRDKVELKRIATLIAKMEGETIEDEINFELKVVPRSTLDKLSREQLHKLESLIETFYLENKRNKRAMYVDKSVMDGMIAQLDLDTSKFTKDEITNQLSKDALDAYRTFFRDIANEKRNEYFESLINNHHLRPKEGLILESPDDIPEQVRQKLLDSERISITKLDACCDDFASRPCNEEVGYDDVHDDEGGASGDDDTDNLYIEKHGWLFNRIKEEPRDDYEDDAPSEDEIVVNDLVASEMEVTLGLQVQQTPTSAAKSDESTDQSELEPNSHSPATEQSNPHKRPKHDDSTEGDFQLLGVVEPTDKIDIITIDDD